MNKKIYRIVFIALFILAVAVIGSYFSGFWSKLTNNQHLADINKKLIQEEKKTVPQGLVCLKKAYPQFIDSIGENFLIWNDGTKMIYDDSTEKKDYQTLLNTADLQDQMVMDYPAGRNYEIPAKNFDPGRVRSEFFFRKMYGSSKAEAQKNITAIQWLPHWVNKKIYVTTVNDVHKKLQKISDELEKHPEWKEYVDNPAGGFYWRTIAGTGRLSMHSFGIAIDINVSKSNYWRWSKDKDAENIKYVNRIPLEIVEIFEKYGFIWGGKWYHYDTMHFEYRPELLN